MMDAGITGAATVVAPIAQECLTGSWVLRNFRYATRIDKNLEKLRRAKSLLEATMKDIKEQQDPIERMTNLCRTNIAEAENIIGTINNLMKECGNKRRTNFYRSFLLRKLGKHVVNMTTVATSMCEDLNKVLPMQDMLPPQDRRWNQDVKIVDLSSQGENVEKLLKWLPSMNRICIWGRPGVGKTTTIKAVQGKITGSHHDFDFVCFVDVWMENKITEYIQEEIWHDLGKSMDETTNCRCRATEISRALSEKKYLLFLDGFHEVDDLKVLLAGVGIHSNHPQGKVVFACRERYKGWTDEDMKICELGDEDATKLFWNAVGSEKTGQTKQTGEDIIKLCGGMPPLLHLIGKSLAEENELQQWQRTRRELKSPSKKQWRDWEEFYKSLRVVYNQLPDVHHKHCLLYWSLFPLEREINQDFTIDCWAAEQFLEGERLGIARDRGRKILDSFTRYSVLEKGKQLGHYKMFLCYQHAALRIANELRSDQYFAQHGEGTEGDEWILAQRVAFASMNNLPIKSNCVGLLTLSIQENSLTEFPGRFFEGVPDLHVLCLRKTAFSKLPPSISKLKKLKGLILDSCNQLEQLPEGIGALRDLEFLVVRLTKINSLPSKIGRLKNLKCLRISFKEASNQNQARAGNMFPGNVIEKLSKLEELTLDVSSTITLWNANADIIAREITKLDQLTHLHFYFHKMDSFEHFIEKSQSWKENGKDFLSFSIFVGEDQNNLAPDVRVLECSAEKNFQFSGGNSFPVAVSNVLKQATSFKLIRHMEATNLNPVADALQQLEVFTVEECNEIQSIITHDANPAVTPASTSGATQPSAFEYLEKLHIIKLPKLASIWVDPIASKSFSVLTTLEIKECTVITKLFSREMIRQLPELQNLLVEDCEEIKTIIEADRKDGPIAFEKLKSLELCKLPRLSSVCDDASLTCPSLEKIVINTCGSLGSLTDIIQNASKLASIHCDETWWSKTRDGRFSYLRPNLC